MLSPSCSGLQGPLGAEQPVPLLSPEHPPPEVTPSHPCLHPLCPRLGLVQPWRDAAVPCHFPLALASLAKGISPLLLHNSGWQAQCHGP